MKRCLSVILLFLAVIITTSDTASAYYSQNLGRFISRDPIGYYGDTNNLYEYVSGNPCGWGDPTGEVKIRIDDPQNKPPWMPQETWDELIAFAEYYNQGYICGTLKANYPNIGHGPGWDAEPEPEPKPQEKPPQSQPPEKQPPQEQPPAGGNGTSPPSGGPIQLPPHIKPPQSKPKPGVYVEGYTGACPDPKLLPPGWVWNKATVAAVFMRCWAINKNDSGQMDEDVCSSCCDWVYDQIPPDIKPGHHMAVEKLYMGCKTGCLTGIKK